MSKTIKYKSDSITVSYDVKKCIHAAECVRGLPDVFDPKKRPWVEPSRASADNLAQVIQRCPSGALQYERHDSGSSEEVPGTNSISVEENGPVHVRGDIKIIDHEGTTIATGTRFTLCRCGDSKNKPFCDNTHNEMGFEASHDLGESGIKPVEDFSDGDRLVITTSKDGPLLFNGPMHLQNADGSDRRAGMKSALCRCGLSSNKPFCDGTHRSAGFTSVAQSED